MGKKVHVSISMDKDFLRSLDETIEEYSLANRSHLIQKWSRVGFKKLKEKMGISAKQNIVPEV